jgi:predicted dehydrogenase
VGLGGWLPAAAAPHDPVRVGVVGLRSRGRELASQLILLPGVQVATLCDVDAAILSEAQRRLSENAGSEIAITADYEQLLGDSRIDAVVIATPDHWHAPMTIAACRAGKDVFVESPCTHRPGDWAAVAAVAQRERRIVQTGLQQRSGAHIQSAVESIRSGELGQIRLARAWMACRRKPIGRRGDSPPPAGVDYTAWLGPAPERPFNSNRFHGNWTRFWDYGSGELGLWGIHWLDVAAWALDLQATVTVSAIGSRIHSTDDQETPETLSVHYQFDQPSPVEVVWEHRTWTVHGNEGRTSGIAFYGDEGTLVLDRGGWKIYDRRDARAESGGELDGPHLANFLHGIRTREQPNASLAVAHLAERLCHLGRLAYREGRVLTEDTRAVVAANA